jgi:Na+/melibiose symporter-like transporter
MRSAAITLVRHHERRAVNPVVNLALFRIRMFAFSALSLLAFTITNSVLSFLLPFYIQDVLHYSPSFMGLLFLAAPVLTIGLAPVAGHLTDRIGPRVPASVGLSVMMAGFVVGWPALEGRLALTLPAAAGLHGRGPGVLQYVEPDRDHRLGAPGVSRVRHRPRADDLRSRIAPGDHWAGRC